MIPGDGLEGETLTKGTGSRSRPSGRRGRTYAIVLAVLVVGVFLAAYVLTGGFHSASGANATVLEPAGYIFTIPVGQFNGIVLNLSASMVLNGSFTNTYGVVLYTMTPAEFLHLVRIGNVSGYTWTLTVPHQTVENLDLIIPPGSWDFVFVNPSSINPTLVGFYTSLTLAPS